MPARRSHRTRLAVALHSLTGLLTVVVAAWTLLAPGQGSPAARLAALVATYLLIAAAALVRVRRTGSRPEDVALVAGLVFYTVGWLVWSLGGTGGATGVLGLVTSGAWVGLFPGFLVALLLLAGRAGIAPTGFALDAIIGAAGSVAAVLGFVVPLLVGPVPAAVLPVGMEALYLAGNVAMAVLTATLAVAIGPRAVPQLSARLGGVVLLGLGSLLALRSAAVGAPFTVDSPAMAPWLLGALLLGMSAGWRVEAAVRAPRRRSVLVMPVVGILVALVVLAHGAGGLAKVFAVGAVALATVRLGLAFLQADALADSRALAMTDELTGLANRRAFFTIAGSRIATGRPGTVAMLDLDGFKEVNDTLGHAAGDQLLVLVARRLVAATRTASGRPGDLVARLGGDEFAVLLPDAIGPAGTAAVDRLLGAAAARFEVDGSPVQVSIAAGVVHAPEHGSDLGELLRRADVAMYAAKARRVRVEVYRPELDTRSRDWLARVERLRLALAEGGLEVHFQPKVDLTTGALAGVEALARLRVGGSLLSPADFLEPLTRAGELGALTHQVLDLALAQARRWLDEGRWLPVAVNVSAEALAGGRLRAEVLEALARHGLPGSTLVVELTERDLLADHTTGAETFVALRAAGIRVSVDDYGTGYSSLAYLRDLPIDEVKLDRTFVETMVGDERATRVVESTVALAHALGQRVVAEGVEDAASLAAVRAAGCDEVQGYLIARPMPAADLAAWLTRTGDPADLAPTGPFRS